MKRLCVVFIVFLIGLHMPMVVPAEEQMRVIQQLLQRVRDPSVPVTRTTLEEIAVAAYQVVINVPFVGLQDSHAALEALIRLKKALIARSGMVERLLALRMQGALDAALLYDVNRRAMLRNGESVTPLYTPGFGTDELVSALLEQNAMAEVEQIDYILGLNGPFAQFCRRKQFDAADVLSGKARRSFPDELGHRASLEISSQVLDGLKKMDTLTMQDALFLYSLESIDHARDVRMLWDVFASDQGFYLRHMDSTNRDAIAKILSSRPYRRRLHSGMRNKAFTIEGTGRDYATSHYYPVLVTLFFAPYFGDVTAIAAQHEGIFSWIESTGGDLSKLRTGMWLELDE